MRTCQHTHTCVSHCHHCQYTHAHCHHLHQRVCVFVFLCVRVCVCGTPSSTMSAPRCVHRCFPWVIIIGIHHWLSRLNTEVLSRHAPSHSKIDHHTHCLAVGQLQLSDLPVTNKSEKKCGHSRHQSSGWVRMQRALLKDATGEKRRERRRDGSGLNHMIFDVDARPTQSPCKQSQGTGLALRKWVQESRQLT